MAFPPEFIDKIKDANPIETAFSEYTSLKRSGSDYVCLCPFHNEDTPSCHVYTSTRSFYCFGCGTGGDVITFNSLTNNISYFESIKMLAERSGLSLPNSDSRYSYDEKKRKRTLEMNKLAARYFFSNLINKNDTRGLAYLMGQRRLSKATIIKYGLGYIGDSWNNLTDYLLSKGFSEQEIIEASLGTRSQKNNRVYDFFRNRVMFPFIDLRGNIVGFGGRTLDPNDKRKYLNSRDTICYDKNRFLFSLNFAKNVSTKSKRIILCEGNLDVISLNQAGFEEAVASCGTALTPKQVKLISTYAKEVYICYDGDEAGIKATKKAAGLFLNTTLKVKIIQIADTDNKYGKKAKDPDEYILKYGADRFEALLNGSSDSVSFELKKAGEKYDLSETGGKAEYIKEALEILRRIPDKSVRESYIKEVSEKSGISVNAIHDDLNKRDKKDQYFARKRHSQQIISFAKNNDTFFPELADYKKDVVNEWNVLHYIYYHQDSAKQLENRLLPENFTAKFNQRLYKSLMYRILNGLDTSPSSFSEDFQPDEIGELTAILEARHPNIIILELGEQDFKEAVHSVLKPRQQSQTNLTDEEFEKFVKQQQEKQQ